MAKIYDKTPEWARREKAKAHIQAGKDPEELPLDVSRIAHGWLSREAKKKYDNDHRYFSDLGAARTILVEHYGAHWSDVPDSCIRDMWRSDIEWWKNEERTLLARAMRDEAKYLALQVQQINTQLCRQILEAARNIKAMIDRPKDERVRERALEQIGPAARQAERYKSRPVVLDDSAA